MSDSSSDEELANIFNNLEVSSTGAVAPTPYRSSSETTPRIRPSAPTPLQSQHRPIARKRVDETLPIEYSNIREENLKKIRQGNVRRKRKNNTEKQYTEVDSDSSLSNDSKETDDPDIKIEEMIDEIDNIYKYNDHEFDEFFSDLGDLLTNHSIRQPYLNNIFPRLREIKSTYSRGPSYIRHKGEQIESFLNSYDPNHSSYNFHPGKNTRKRGIGGRKQKKTRKYNKNKKNIKKSKKNKKKSIKKRKKTRKYKKKGGMIGRITQKMGKPLTTMTKRNIGIPISKNDINLSKMSLSEKKRMLDSLTHERKLDIDWRKDYIIPTIINLENKKNKSLKEKNLLEETHQSLIDSREIVSELDNEIRILENNIYNTNRVEYKKAR